jgi:hypothetical protein
MDKEYLLEILEGYHKAGWIIIALPKDIAESVVGRPATQTLAFELLARIREDRHKLEMLQGELDMFRGG